MPPPSTRSSTRWSARRPDAPRSSSLTVSARYVWPIALSSSMGGASSRKAAMKNSWPARVATLIFINFRFPREGPVASMLRTKVANYNEPKILLHSHYSCHPYLRYQGSQDANTLRAVVHDRD